MIRAASAPPVAPAPHAQLDLAFAGSADGLGLGGGLGLAGGLVGVSLAGGTAGAAGAGLVQVPVAPGGQKISSP